MRTDRIDELKKIELDIYDNEYEKELNSFLSVRLDFRNYLTYYELTDEQKSIYIVNYSQYNANVNKSQCKFAKKQEVVLWKYKKFKELH